LELENHHGLRLSGQSDIVEIQPSLYTELQENPFADALSMFHGKKTAAAAVVVQLNKSKPKMSIDYERVVFRPGGQRLQGNYEADGLIKLVALAEGHIGLLITKLAELELELNSKAILLDKAIFSIADLRKDVHKWRSRKTMKKKYELDWSDDSTFENSDQQHKRHKAEASTLTAVRIALEYGNRGRIKSIS
jgi:hypothetical protein